MIKAHSLLYAIYICLLVSIICGALLYFSNLYNLLNQHYNLREEMYIHNQSSVNFALANFNTNSEVKTIEKENGIEGSYLSKKFGLLTLLITKSVFQNDTISSTFFVGTYNDKSPALYLANFTKSLSYTGQVKIFGNCFLPTNHIENSFVLNKVNKLEQKGEVAISNIKLPDLRPEFYEIFEKKPGNVNLGVSMNSDTISFNSFERPVKLLKINPVLGRVAIKGNFILQSNDSIVVSRNTILEDVILMAPKIIFEEGFKGNVQAFATLKISIEQKVDLDYPSVVCVYNKYVEESSIKIGKDVRVKGAIVLFGNKFEDVQKNSLEIESGARIIGDIYCTGKLDLKSDVYGSVYTNRFFFKTNSSVYDNLISDIEINPSKKPTFFIDVPLFGTKNTNYAILKKLL